MNAFYIPPERWDGPLALMGQEADHARVLRLHSGDNVRIFNGEGRSALCRVAATKAGEFALDLLEEEFTPPPASRAIIALAVSKAVRRGFFMEKASELGAWEVWLWQARRSQGKISPAQARACESQLISGLKQSGNPWLPTLRVLPGAAEVAQLAATLDFRILPWEEQAGGPMLEKGQLGRPGTTIFVIGPEGGIAPEELELYLGAGFTTVSLGKRVLRCETAAALCLGLHWWAAQLPGAPNHNDQGQE